MVLTEKELSVKVYIEHVGTMFSSKPGLGAYIEYYNKNIQKYHDYDKQYVASVARVDKQSRNGFYIKRVELMQIFEKLKKYDRLEKLKKLNESF